MIKNNNLKRKNILLYTIFFIFIAICIILVAIDFDDIVSRITSLILATISGILLLLEFKRGKDIEEAQFIYTLNAEFINNEDLKYIYSEINKHGKKTVFKDEDFPKIVCYLTFLESFFAMIERKVLKISMIDNLYANRFFMIVSNPSIQKMQLIKDKDLYHNIYYLDFIWRKYRIKIQKEDLYSESSLHINNKDYYEKIITNKFGINSFK